MHLLWVMWTLVYIAVVREKPCPYSDLFSSSLTDGSLSEMLIDPETQVASGLPLDQSLFYLQQVLYGVHYLHESQHVLHLDLKCENIERRVRDRFTHVPTTHR